MANDVFQVNVIGSVAGEYVENVWHFVSSVANSGTPGADAEAMLNALQTSVQTPYLDCLSDDFELGGYKSKRVNNTGGPTAVLLAAGAPGTGGAPSVVSGEGGLITFGYFSSLSAKPRWRTTRIFTPGVYLGAIVGNVLSAPYLARLQVFADALNTGFAAGGATYLYCGYQRASGHPYTVNAPQVSSLIGTQRRRYKPSI